MKRNNIPEIRLLPLRHCRLSSFLISSASNVRHSTTNARASIEVEKKFRWDNDRVAAIVRDAEFVRELTFTDVYFDNDKYALTTRDIWLRQRDSVFECKVQLPVANGASSEVDRYDELTKNEEIRSFIVRMKEAGHLSCAMQRHIDVILPPSRLSLKHKGCDNEQNMTEWLKDYGLNPFARINTRRRRYRKGKFAIDLDEVDYGKESSSLYLIGEIEVVVEEDNVEEAVREVLDFCRTNGLDYKPPIRGKVLEWLARYDVAHNAALEKAGLFARKGA